MVGELDLLAAPPPPPPARLHHLLPPLLPLPLRRRAARAAREHLHQLLVCAPAELLRAAAELHHLRAATAT